MATPGSSEGESSGREPAVAATPDAATPDLATQTASTNERDRADLARAEAARRDGRLYEADGIARDVLRRSPDAPQALAIRAYVATSLGVWDEALALIDSALDARAEPAWLMLRCHLHRRAFRLDAALADAEATLARVAAAQRLEPLIELARIHVDRDACDDAARAFLAALAIDPDSAQAHLGLGQVLLSRGDFAAGWLEYEWRNRLPEAQGTIPAIKAAAWNGMALPDGRLLVISDQGFGDSIQFSRFLPAVAARVRELVVACDADLADLFGRIPGVARCWARWRDIPGFTAYARLSSLPFLLQARPAEFAAAVSGIAAEPERVETWNARLGPRPAAGRIGLFWSGRPTHPNNARRSLPFAALRPILAASDAEFVSVQKVLEPGDAAAMATAGVRDIAADIRDFSDTAGVLRNLDLLITVDSAVAHLAGTLGVPVWILLPRPADWRWLREGNGSVWYPSVRLFRQDTVGDWNGPIEAVVHELARRYVARPRQGLVGGAPLA